MKPRQDPIAFMERWKQALEALRRLLSPMPQRPALARKRIRAQRRSRRARQGDHHV